MAIVIAALVAFGYGTLSALVPIFNAEAFIAVAAAGASVTALWASVVGLSAGMTLGKVIVFELSRKGRTMAEQRAGATKKRTEPRTRCGRRLRNLGEGLLSWLEDPWLGPVTIFLAATIGIPPLLVAAVAAGVSRQKVYVFAVVVFVGRFLRFVVIIWPITVAMS